MFGKLAAAYEQRAGIRLVPSFGSTAQLTTQIENGAPYDLFLAADVEHVDRLIEKGFANSRAIYARGRLVLWAPKRPDIRSLADLARRDVRSIVVAKPELAPYGKAAVESLVSLKLWTSIQPKVIYAQNISSAKQYADTGNGDAAFTALALIIDSTGNSINVPEALHGPIDQALCIVVSARQAQRAKACAEFLLGAECRAIFRRSGYL